MKTNGNKWFKKKGKKERLLDNNFSPDLRRI